MRRMMAAVDSTGEMVFARMSAASSTAGRKPRIRVGHAGSALSARSMRMASR